MAAEPMRRAAPLLAVAFALAFAFAWPSAPSQAQTQDAPSVQVAPDETPLIEVAPDETPLAPGDGPPLAIEEEAVSIPGVAVTLRGLDKLSGRVETIEGLVGDVVMYERLEINVKACYSRSAARAPEASVFMQIYDTKYDPARRSFSGWMFASSPALSAMDHPRYDVWVLSCKTS